MSNSAPGDALPDAARNYLALIFGHTVIGHDAGRVAKTM